ncbi:hypothetical protein BSKO_06233 [Bryopsis sp. KO-2023]|nr:hypothetical protein BSKO_06233 [Bryopsis sp. KO-2023]
MLRRAVNTTASSALASQMTNEALHQAATNQTSEVLDVLSTVVTDKKASPTKTWAFQETLLQTREHKGPQGNSLQAVQLNTDAIALVDRWEERVRLIKVV